MAIQDQGAILRSGAGIMPSYSDQMFQRQQRDLAKTQADFQRLATAAKQTEMEDSASYMSEVGQIFQNPTAESIARFQARFPAHQKVIQSAWEAMSDGQQKSELSTLSEIMGAAKNGKYDLAASIARKRYDAEVRGGTANETDQEIVRVLEGGADEEKRAVIGLISHQVLGKVGPDKFGSVFESFSEANEREALLPDKARKAKTEADISEAEAISAPQYYDARARGEVADATKTEIGNRYAPEAAESEIANRNARTSRTNAGGGSGRPASRKKKKEPLTASDAAGNKVQWNGKKWVPLK